MENNLFGGRKIWILVKYIGFYSESLEQMIEKFMKLCENNPKFTRVIW